MSFDDARHRLVKKIISHEKQHGIRNPPPFFPHKMHAITTTLQYFTVSEEPTKKKKKTPVTDIKKDLYSIQRYCGNLIAKNLEPQKNEQNRHLYCN